MARFTEVGFRSRMGAWRVALSMAGYAFLARSSSPSGCPASQKEGVSTQNSTESRPAAEAAERISPTWYSWKNMVETAKTTMILFHNDLPIIKC